ncbi:S-layer homology domain-containing protein [Pseudarthrobacter sulfonivorans]|uniref:S-layer homology domain-containing protein n=1 Tax=Pseudarthrobacter sulfonivorans TaxID=121292 RepID=UPI0027828A51|nr:polysaccharide deacetylase family protein [Pseudarthrobacter sulfonivorans]MDP9997549.1 peptidoglycan/xylan/chitin deacetylase (PgdA/CDA1 family) [Pseudarthrobacter sulfonivorans]
MTKTSSSLARWRAKLVTIGVVAPALAAALLTPGVANAAIDNPAPSPLVSFTFDDGGLSALTQAAPTLRKHGLTGTNYIVTDCVGLTALPNTCRADADVPYMSWDQILELQNTYGWEIGSHTVSHPCLVSVGNDCQANKLTPAQVDAELANSKAALAARGINATAFAPPYGDYDMSVVAQVAKYYSSMRGFADTGNNVWPLGDYLLHNVPVQEVTTPVSALKLKVDEAIRDKKWVVFTFHDIRPNPSQDPDYYQYGTAELDELAAYVKTKVAAGEIKNVNVSQGLVTGTPNMMPNPTFNNGLGDGWRTDSVTSIAADSGNNGSYPDSTNSIKLVSGATPAHLFSPQVSVSPTTTYLFKAFLNVAAITTGEVWFYVDEYDSSGAWISGQFKKVEDSRWVEAMNFSYTPTSANVAKASLQIGVNGTGITAYVDNVQMLAPGYLPPTVSPFADVPTSHNFYKQIAWLRAQGISEGWVENGVRTFRPAEKINRDQMAAFLYRMSGTTDAQYTPPAVSPFADVPTNHTFYRQISWLRAQGISEGWVENGVRTFRPAEQINRDQMAAFLYRMSGTTDAQYTPPAVSPFADVSTSHTFYRQISWLRAQGISEGWVENGVRTFRPAEQINRDQMAAFLYRMSNPAG